MRNEPEKKGSGRYIVSKVVGDCIYKAFSHTSADDEMSLRQCRSALLLLVLVFVGDFRGDFADFG